MTFTRTWSPVRSAFAVWVFVIEPSFMPLKTVKVGMLTSDFADLCQVAGR